jgi:PAS domain S-box-containing protein
MTTELRETDISVVGDIPWGTHFCHFYETKEDLLDILVPYFRAGLENNEFCVWVVSEPLGLEEATDALKRAVPEAERYLAAGSMRVVAHPASRRRPPPADSIEIVPYTEWYLKDGVFDAKLVMDGLLEKLDEALARGYAGMRANCNESWLTKESWADFGRFEKALDEALAGRRMIVLCSYPLADAGAAEILDVVRTHQFAVVRRNNNWEVVETPELKEAKAEIKRLNEGLERRVVERTRELEAANEKLRGEIAERKRAEEALREVNSKLDLILNNSPLPITSADDRGRITGWNKAAEHLFGWTAEEAVGLVCPTIPPEQTEEYLEMIRMVMQGETFVGLVLYRQKKGGNLLTCSVSVAPQRDGRGEPVGVTLIVEDITERKRTEEALRESQQLLQLVLATLPVGVMVTDRAGDTILTNVASKRIWGDIIVSGRQRWAQSKGLWHDSGERIAPTAWASARALSEGRTSLNELIDIETYDGQLKTIENSAAPIHNAEGQIVGAVIVNKDVTERVRAEEQLRRSNEELRALSSRLRSVREEESARIAREIHDHLGAELSSLKWGLEEAGEDMSEITDLSQLADLREKVAGIVKLTDNAVGTVQRISSELRPTALEEFGLAEALQWHAQQFQARTGIIVNCDCQTEAANLNREQATAIFRIVQEALTNVLRHAQATKVEISMRQEDDLFVLTINDNGRGITEEEKWGSQSLGLIGMRERTHLLGGEIGIEGREGRGTMITVKVPAPAKKLVKSSPSN